MCIDRSTVPDMSESILLPDGQDLVDEESSFQVTTVANGNGHVKTETDTTLVEPTVVPIGKLENTFVEGESHVLISTSYILGLHSWGQSTRSPRPPRIQLPNNPPFWMNLVRLREKL